MTHVMRSVRLDSKPVRIARAGGGLVVVVFPYEIKLFTSDFKEVGSLKYGYFHLGLIGIVDITMAGQSTIALLVSAMMPFSDGEIRLIHIDSARLEEQQHKIKTPNSCSGIYYQFEHLFVSCKETPGKILMMNMHGQRIHVFRHNGEACMFSKDISKLSVSKPFKVFAVEKESIKTFDVEHVTYKVMNFIKEPMRVKDIAVMENGNLLFMTNTEIAAIDSKTNGYWRHYFFEIEEWGGHLVTMSYLESSNVLLIVIEKGFFSKKVTLEAIQLDENLHQSV